MKLVDRAARYFGVESEPRTSIKIGRWECLIVLPDRAGGTAIAYYDEKHRPNAPQGEYIWLTAEQRDALADALCDAQEPPIQEQYRMAANLG